MAFSDRNYRTSRGRSGGGGGGNVFRRIFGEGENPLMWSLPLFTLFGIRVRLHLIYAIYIVAEIVTSINRGAIGVQFTASAMAVLFLIVLLHEFGHCFACRYVGGEANRILMWPLGGLAYCSPPHQWRASLITTAGGPLVNVVLVPVTAAVFLASGASVGDLLFNPFSPDRWLAATNIGTITGIIAFWAYYTNLVLLAFNVLCPMFPLDGGRMLQEVLWSRLGYRRSMQIAVNIGLVSAVVLGIFGLVSGETLLFAIAVFAGFTCYQEKRRLEFETDSFADPRFEAVAERQTRAARREMDRAARRRREEAVLQEEVDRILAKIAANGIQSLTGKEKRVLRDATEKQRKP